MTPPRADINEARAATPPWTGASRHRILEAQAEAATFFARSLQAPLGDGPRDYLSSRGLESAMDSEMWEAGYAPPGWTALTEHLRRRGFDDETVCTSGLGLQTRRHTVVDRFRDRVTFGVRNEQGKVIAFIARAAPAATGVPKYLNSPRSVVYDKSATLFGLGEQRARLEQGGIPVLVEGPLDAIAVSVASAPGTPPMVGLSPCGTALTHAHVRALSRVTATPVLVAFDGDRAGTSAAVRAHATMAGTIRRLRAVRMESGEDPASILAARGARGLRSALATTMPLADLVVDEVLSQYAESFDNAEARLCALRQLGPVVAGLPRYDVARQAARLSSLLGFDHTTIARELAEAATRSASTRSQPGGGRSCPQSQRGPGDRLPRAEGLGSTRAAGGPVR